VVAKKSPTAAAKARAKAQRARRLRKLIAESEALPHFLYPIEIFERANALARLPHSRALIEALLALAAHENPHARRVALIAIRHRKPWKQPGVIDALVAALADPEGWVRYDAAWALGESGIANKAVVAGLRALTKGAKKVEDISDADAQARAQAAESLAALLK
jgi:HEAT repeat protein